MESFASICRSQSALLVEREGSLRSRYRRTVTRTYVWKSRCLALLDTLVLRLYESEQSEGSPSLSIKIDQYVEAARVDGHPTHIEITCQQPNLQYDGSDLPRLHQDNGTKAHWRIRFQSEDVATMWRDAINGAATQSALPISGAVINSTAEPRNGAVAANLQAVFPSRGLVCLILCLLVFTALIQTAKRDSHHAPVVWLRPDLSPQSLHTQTYHATRPEIVDTTIRKMISLGRDCFRASGTFPPGSFVHDYFLVPLASSAIFAISLLSLAAKVIHWRILLATFLLASSALLGQDTYENHFRHPLVYGLFWNWYAQGGICLAFFTIAILQVKRALLPRERSPRVLISNQRKASAAVSAVAASLALPLSLHGLTTSNGVTLARYIVLAALLFFVGAHFFGWALEEHRFGQAIYQISLVPFVLGKCVARNAEVCGRFLLLEYIWPFCCSATNTGKRFFVQAWSGLFCPLWIQAVATFRGLNNIWLCLADELFSIASYTRGFLVFILNDVLLNVGRPVWEIGRHAWVLVVSSFMEALVRVGRFVWEIGRHTWGHLAFVLNEVLSNVGRPVWEILKAVLHTAKEATIGVTQALSMLVAAICKRVHSLLLWARSAVIRRVADAFIRPCIGAVISVLRRVWSSAFIPLLRRAGIFIDRVCEVLVPLLSPFFKKYWYLVSTILAMNGSWRCVAAVLGDNAMTAKMKYMLGAWTLATIAYATTETVILTRDFVAPQHVMVDASALRFMDMCYGLSRIFGSGWLVFSKVFDLALKAVDFVIRKSFSSFWIIMLVSRSVFKPLFSSVVTPLKHVWNKPYFSMLVASGVVLIAYLTHTSQSSWSPSFSRIVTVITPNLVFWASVIGSLSERILVIGKIMYILGVEVYSPVANADASSPNLALVWWLFAVAATKGRARVRIKTFAVPIVIFYASGMVTSSIARAGVFTFVLWFLLSLLVDRYEEGSHERARAESGNMPRWLNTESRSEECVVCFDSLQETQATMLPCGHTYHGDCIRKWLKTSKEQRCPICRRATGGWNRVLEVAF